MSIPIYLGVLRTKSTTFHMLGKYSTTELHPNPYTSFLEPSRTHSSDFWWHPNWLKLCPLLLVAAEGHLPASTVVQRFFRVRLD